MNPKKLKFYMKEDHFEIRAKCKSTGKWEKIAVCHASAKQAILNGETHLIKWNHDVGTLL